MKSTMSKKKGKIAAVERCREKKKRAQQFGKSNRNVDESPTQTFEGKKSR